MRQFSVSKTLRALLFFIPVALVTPALGEELKITVTNNQPAGGFAFSPFWFGLHDGTFKTFDPGGTASSALQNVAELASLSAIQGVFAGHGAQTSVGMAPYGPGSSASALLSVDSPTTERFLSFAAMVVPSNDFFFGNANPTQFALFDASGKFVGPTTIKLYGSNVWDAGTEVDDIGFGAAFIVGDDIHDHAAENGTIALVDYGSGHDQDYLNSILGKATPYGYDISHLISPNDLIATIQISAVPEPSAVVMMTMGAVGATILCVRPRRSLS